MAEIRVRVGQQNAIRVASTGAVSTGPLAQVATDIDVTSRANRTFLMYDAATGKWRDRNPDEVLSAATTEPNQPGLPADFENQLDIDLDDRINLDAGSF